ncbi:MAG: OmpH family outer membrane protein [Candidatus Aureabacteria bacterium]|nr:OmpH family outer membrane protein [Candidatus Auribacterota bacterium]
MHSLRTLRRAALFTALALTLSGCGRGRDIAVVEIDAVFKEYGRSRQIQDGIEKEKQELETRGQQMLDEINKLVKESEILNDEARRERESRIKEKTAALETYRRGATKNLIDKTNEQYQMLLADVRAAAAVVARKRGIGVVFDSSAALYGAKGIDITPAVIAELNRAPAIQPQAPPKSKSQ